MKETFFQKKGEKSPLRKHGNLMRSAFSFITAFCILFIIFPLISAGAEGGGPESVLRWATIAPENTVWGDTLNQISREVREKSGGRLKNVWYYGGIMGDEPDAIRKMKLGQLHGSALISVGMSKLAPEILAFSLPDLFANYDEVDCVMDRAWPLVKRILAKRGYVAMGWSDVGFTVLFSQQNLRTPEDFRKTKAWNWIGLEADKATFEIFGMENLVPLTFPEVLPALRTGMVETAYATYYTAIAVQWHAYVRYMTDPARFGRIYTPSLMVLSREAYDSLRPELRGILQESIDAHFPQMRKKLRADEEHARKMLLQRGIKTMDTSREFLEGAKDKAYLLFEDWEGKFYPEWLIQGVLKARDECRGVEVAVMQSAKSGVYDVVVEGFKDMIPVPTVYQLPDEKSLARLQRSSPTVVVGVGSKASAFVKKKLPGVPLVYSMVVDPERYDLSGGNVTGVLLGIPAVEQLKIFKN